MARDSNGNTVITFRINETQYTEESDDENDLRASNLSSSSTSIQSNEKLDGLKRSRSIVNERCCDVIMQ
jgi:hypothetical protein